jgi:hypothetical protein
LKIIAKGYKIMGAFIYTGGIVDTSGLRYSATIDKTLFFEDLTSEYSEKLFQSFI